MPIIFKYFILYALYFIKKQQSGKLIVELVYDFHVFTKSINLKRNELEKIYKVEIDGLFDRFNYTLRFINPQNPGLSIITAPVMTPTY